MCFSLAWLEQLLVWLVIIVAIVMLLRLVIPAVLGALGVGGGIILGAINILVWADKNRKPSACRFGGLFVRSHTTSHGRSGVPERSRR